MSNAISLINADVFTLFLNQYYATHRKDFTGAQALADFNLEFEYAVNIAPVFSLTDNIHLNTPVADNTPTFSVTMPGVVINLYEYANGQRGALQGSVTFAVIISGIFVLNNNRITITGLSGLVEGGNDMRLMNEVVNHKVISELQNRISGLSLPQVIELLGQALPIQLTALTKDTGHLRLEMTVAGGSDGCNLQLGSGSIFGVALNQDALQRIVNLSNMFPVRQTDQTESVSGGWGYKAAYNAITDTPVIFIGGNNATATVQIYIHVDVTLVNWFKDVHISFDLPPAPATIGIHLVQHGKSATLSLNLDRLDFNLPSIDLPAPFGSLTADISNWISGPVRSTIETAVWQALQKIQPTLFALPDSLPGTNLAANFCFFGFTNAAATGIFQVS
ncbi:MAG: hypothetical protein U0350_28835 [Caldilineaceae bacterium]